ncbi:MAG: DEAD/DEAH box helicase, partial [Oscillochloris sp.]|nr:DEAD/DEAH box helicase [Oscillochloris sp.]
MYDNLSRPVRLQLGTSGLVRPSLCYTFAIATQGFLDHLFMLIGLDMPTGRTRMYVDIFHLRQQIIDPYAAYTRSFLTIYDLTIQAYVDRALADGRLWPDALIQLSPAYDQAETVADLVRLTLLHPLCGDIFRSARNGALESLRLFRHQKQAIDLAASGRNYIVTTGTGSGKSLTYIVPIVNHILSHTPEQGKVRAIIVYPMNALINSQAKAIERFFSNVPGGCPVRFARYTGQESAADKQRIKADPPHMLLTNNEIG